MNVGVRITPVVVYAAVLVACTTTEQELSISMTADAEAINQARERWGQAYEDGDADAFVSHITADAVWMPHTGDLIVGRDKVHAIYANYFKGIKADLTLSSAELEVAGDWAFERGTAISIRNPKDGSSRLRQNANYMSIWRRESDGAWRIARLITVGDYRPVEDGGK